MAVLAQHAAHGQPVDRLVLDQKQAQGALGSICVLRRGGILWLGRHGQGQGAQGDGPDPGFAVDVDVAVHEPDQPFDDGKPEPGTLMEPGDRVVHLGEGLENRREFVGGDADAGIGNGQGQAHPARFRIRHGAGFHPNLAGVGELDGIAHEVEQDLADAALVSHEPVRNRGRKDRDQGNVPLDQGGLEHGPGGREDIGQPEGGLGQDEFAGFHPGQVENVAEQPGESAPGIQGRSHAFGLFGIEGRVLQELEHAEQAV